VERLQSRARAAGRPELGPDELAMVLEAMTNLPGDVIDTLTQQAGAEALARSEEHRAAAAERARAGDLGTAVDLPATPSTDERTVGLVAAHRDTGLADAARAHAGASRSAAQLAAKSFPYSAAEAVRAASAPGVDNAARTATRIHSPYVAKRPRRSL
jgi:regulator of protease activity HflC (stomatin/prohibitin superfamily)